MNVFGSWQQHDVDAHNARVAKQSRAGASVIKTTAEPSLCRAQEAAGGSASSPARPSDDPESALHDFIINFAHARGWLAIHSRMDKPTTTALGVSDFILVTPNTVYFIEAKRKGNKVTPKQRAFLTAIKCLGWPSAVVFSKEEFLQYIESKS